MPGGIGKLNNREIENRRTVGFQYQLQITRLQIIRLSLPHTRRLLLVS